MRVGTLQAGAGTTTADAQTTSYSELIAVDPSRVALLIHNPTANGILSINWDNGVNAAVEIAAGASYEVPEKVVTLAIYGKVATAGNVNVTAFK